MIDATRGYGQAVVAIAQAEDALESVESDLLAVARAIAGNRDLAERLTDLQIPVGNRLRFVESDILTAAHPASRTALAMLISANRVMDLEAIASHVSHAAAELRDRGLAEVWVAAPLDHAQSDALRQALERATGKSLELRVHVDESVVGGVRAQVGDTVIDGSLAKRLDDVRTRIGA